MKRMVLQNKGFVKRMGGRFFTDISPTLNATDYKEPNLVIEYDIDSTPTTEYLGRVQDEFRIRTDSPWKGL